MTKNYKFMLQENMYDCGVAALKTIFLQYGKKIKSNDVVRKTTSQGTTAYELISSSKKLGLNAKGVRTTLDTLTIKHLPCIAHIIKDKNYFHYIVIFEKNNKNKTLVILDPAIGIKTITYEEFNEETTNIFILFDDKKMQKEKDKRFKNVIKSLLKINKKEVIETLKIDQYTLDDIIDCLIKPNRSIRDQYQTPLLKKDILHIEDLKPGMVLEGTVRNVVDFGAFVDIGLKNDGLVHISKMSKQRIKHPLDVLSIGDIVEVNVIDVDLNKKRVSLSMI